MAFNSSAKNAALRIVEEFADAVILEVRRQYITDDFRHACQTCLIISNSNVTTLHEIVIGWIHLLQITIGQRAKACRLVILMNLVVVFRDFRFGVESLAAEWSRAAKFLRERSFFGQRRISQNIGCICEFLGKIIEGADYKRV